MSERATYDKVKYFEGRVTHFKWNDSHAPPFSLLFDVCRLASEWITSKLKNFLTLIIDNKDNVLVVHCNAGKGRTGSAICAILLYMKVFNDIESCLKLFGYQRFSCTKGVTQPCQLRYLYYFEAFFRRKILSPCLKRLKGI